MKCSDLQDKISPYVDGHASAEDTALLEGHFAVCPLCRERADQIRSIRSSLRQFDRPALPANIANRARLAVKSEIRSRSYMPMNTSRIEWFQMRLMPIAAGVMTSLLIGISFLSLMLSGGLAIDDYTARTTSSDSRIMIGDNGPEANRLKSGEISPIEFARSRMAVAGESPSINPQGTLASLSKTLANHGIRNSEIVVVADVFSNGLARIAEVVEPSQNVGAVDELEKALGSDIANAPFVPASMDNRSANVRVVLKFQNVEVNTRRSPKRK